MTLQEYRDLLSMSCTTVGECDRCHTESAVKILDPDDPGEFMWCDDCIRAKIARMERRAIGLTPIVDGAMRRACEAMARLPEINFRHCAVGETIRLARTALELAEREATAVGAA